MLGNQKGMTLVEIMIVLAIIAGVTGLLVVGFGSRIDKANVQKVKIQISQISQQLDVFYSDCGFYPTTDQGLEALLEAPESEPTCSNWGPEPYIKKDLIRDPWKTPLDYEEDGSTYVITSFGRDKRPGGKDFDKDIRSSDE